MRVVNDIVSNMETSLFNSNFIHSNICEYVEFTDFSYFLSDIVVMNNFPENESLTSHPSVSRQNVFAYVCDCSDVRQNTLKEDCNLPGFVRTHRNPLLPSFCFTEEEMRLKRASHKPLRVQTWQHLGSSSRYRVAERDSNGSSRWPEKRGRSSVAMSSKA